MFIIGVNWEQNSSVSLFKNGELLGAVSQERFSKVKNDERYPIDAINFLCKNHKVNKNKIQNVIFVSKDWGPLWILCRHYTKFTVKDYIDEQNKIWWPKIYENKKISPLEVFENKLDLDQFPGKSFWKNIIKQYEGTMAHPSEKKLSSLGQTIRREVVKKHLGKNIKVNFVDHSNSHTSYAYFSQADRQNKFLAISLDAFGDDVNYSARVFEKSDKKIISNIIVNGNNFIVGRLYRYITLILGLKPNEHEFKVMGLAPYCKPKYYSALLKKFKTLQDVDGLNFKYLNKPKDHYFQIREMLIGERFDTIAGALQAYTEYLITKWIRNLVKSTKVKDICLAGGVAMNVKANMKISELREVNSLHVPLCPDDSSQAIGCVYEYLHNFKIQKKIFHISTPYLGNKIQENISHKKGIVHSLKKYLNNINKTKDYKIITKDYLNVAVNLLVKNNVIGLVHGKEEFGARALGNRSIIANPKNNNIKFKINEKIKDRDFWMPFAASIIESHAHLYLKFNNSNSYRYMTNTCASTLEGRERIQAALHPYDFTCRPQIIEKGTNPFYETLIKKFGDKTGTYALLNTSLNLHGFPICSNEIDALEVLIKSDLDGLLFKDFLLLKSNIKI